AQPGEVDRLASVERQVDATKKTLNKLIKRLRKDATATEVAAAGTGDGSEEG
ncbi:hypothetical protein LCGC14_1767010, partial [marine sediment metagenome]